MNALRIVLSLLAGFAAVILTEVFAVLWMSLAPLDLDLTGSLFLTVVTPAVLLVHLVLAVVCWKIFEPNPARNPAIFVLSHAVFQTVELFSFFNPPANVAAYVTIILVSGFGVTGVFRHYLWCPSCAQIGKL